MDIRFLSLLVVASFFGSAVAADVEFQEVAATVESAGEGFFIYVKSLRGAILNEEVLAELNARYAQLTLREEKTAAVALVLLTLNQVVLFDAERECFVLVPVRIIVEPAREDVLPEVAPAVRVAAVMSGVAGF
ncbi:TPA: hypothetical protein DCW54_02975 [Candidatus Dependentiae bacterium]|nr:MAG: hypothetical protein A2017_11180 [Lentisphaerae bacterium GWF2_44_16]HAU30563.1 hypothetical protein [Candidatus Dependentiae bacterium]